MLCALLRFISTNQATTDPAGPYRHEADAVHCSRCNDLLPLCCRFRGDNELASAVGVLKCSAVLLGVCSGGCSGAPGVLLRCSGRAPPVRQEGSAARPRLHGGTPLNLPTVFYACHCSADWAGPARVSVA